MEPEALGPDCYYCNFFFLRRVGSKFVSCSTFSHDAHVRLISDRFALNANANPDAEATEENAVQQHRHGRSVEVV